jgi:hypothetical protein
MLIAIGVLVIGGAGTSIWLMLKQQPAIPTSFQQQVSFPIYYPQTLPKGYELEKDSVKVENKTLSFSIKSKNAVYVIEQPVPQNPPNLKSIEGFGEIPLLSGQGVSGTVDGHPVAIVLTETTLISLRGEKGESLERLGKIAQSLSSLP